MLKLAFNKCILRGMSEARSYGVVVDAILQYDEEALQRALDCDPSMASAPSADYTPLHYCIAQGWDEGLELLLAAGTFSYSLHNHHDGSHNFGQPPSSRVSCSSHTPHPPSPTNRVGRSARMHVMKGGGPPSHRSVTVIILLS